MEIAEALHHPLLTEWSAIEICADNALAGDWEAAHTAAQRALSLRNYSRVYVGFTRWHETEALLRGGRLTQARELIITAQRFREQERNRADARERLVEIIREAATPKRVRRPTKVPKSSKKKRLDGKKHRAEIKRGRSQID